MGMWVTSGNIARLTAKLDWKFGDVGLPRVRGNTARKDRFNGTLQLHRIARLFRIWPGGPGASGRRSARFWYGFLRWLHTQPNGASGTGSMVADDIIAIMLDAINDVHCRAMNFVAIEGPDVRVSAVTIPAPRDGDPAAYIQVIVLQTIEHGTDNENEPPSAGQDPPAEDLPDPAVDPSTTRKRRLKKTAKKKAAKKKVSKKRAAKKKKL